MKLHRIFIKNQLKLCQKIDEVSLSVHIIFIKCSMKVYSKNRRILTEYSQNVLRKFDNILSNIYQTLGELLLNFLKNLIKN